MTIVEVQVDRLVGPTHHFGGLGVGNVASRSHAGRPSSPAAAAIQGLEKMRLVAGFGAAQFVLPPQIRPDLGLLRSLGFRGDDESVIQRAHDDAPELFSAATSASAMWTANAATVTCRTHGTQATIANLNSSLHRWIEPPATSRELRRLLSPKINVFEPLAGGTATRDEGAANHMRLSDERSDRAFDVFVYGDRSPVPQSFWPRQSRLSFESIARQHQLDDESFILIKQHPDAVDAGVFHNDVVAMSHGAALIHHELAFWDSKRTMEMIRHRFARLTGRQPLLIEVASETLSIEDAVGTYLFNSQLISQTEKGQPPIIICPIEVKRHRTARALVETWKRDGVFSDIAYVDLGQSMAGGGGPACLRLRIPMLPDQVAAMHPGCRWTPKLHDALESIIRNQYPTSVSLKEMASMEFFSLAKQIQKQIENELGMTE